jgi:predicted phage tail protein
MYSIKVAVDSNGNQYAAGMGIGVQNTPSGMQSQVLFLADRFAVMTQAGGAVTLPFVIQNGQTFIRDTFIHDGRSVCQNRQLYSVFNLGRNRERWLAHQKSGYATFNNVTVRGSIYATNGNFSFNGSGNTTVINGNGVTINILVVAHRTWDMVIICRQDY